MLRAYETLLRQYLELFPVVALLGVRQCGKTTLLERLPEDWKRYDLERQSDLQLLEKDPDTFLRLNPRRIAIDEAQRLPSLFPALRVAVDAQRQERGRFVLTGSSSPELVKGLSESLAGRIAVIEMAPFSWEEVTETSGQDGLLNRLQDRSAKNEELIDGLKPRGTLQHVHEYWLRGGYPEPWLHPDPVFHRIWLDQYIGSYVERDIRALFPGLDAVRFRRFTGLLSGLSGRIINYTEVARVLGVSQPTVRDYFEIVHGTFLWRNLPAYAGSSLKRLVKHPRGYMRDSGLLHGLLKIPDLDLLQTHPQAGASWEGMVIEEILRQLQCLGVSCDASYYRTSAGAEVDLVLEGDFGHVAIEIKHASAVGGHDLRSIQNLVKEKKMRLGIIVNNDITPRIYSDDLIGVPFSYL